MEFLDTIIFAMVAMLVVIVGVMPRYLAYLENKRIRQRLRQTVPRYRLFKMLSYLGADFEKYISRLPADDITRHVLNCNACPNLDICDECLLNGRQQKDMGFCPNYKSLIASSKMLAD